MLATRASVEQAQALIGEFGRAATWNEAARTVVVQEAGRVRRASRKRGGTSRRSRALRAGGRPGRVLVVSAGTSDLPVAEEAAVTLEFMGLSVGRVYDAGVAGIHRLLKHVRALRKASAIVVVAGMEGALASVVGGITDRPVIAVPTSAGYGASFGGLAALLAMLNSCAAGIRSPRIIESRSSQRWLVDQGAKDKARIAHHHVSHWFQQPHGRILDELEFGRPTRVRRS